MYSLEKNVAEKEERVLLSSADDFYGVLKKYSHNQNGTFSDHASKLQISKSWDSKNKCYSSANRKFW